MFDKAGSSSRLETLLAPLDSSQIGVEIFFALSGYLITSILVRERVATGSISLRRFYSRRALRIWPAFFSLIVAMLLIADLASSVRVSHGQALSAALFIWNYSPASGGWWLGHTWSLSIEEQFYLLWPLVLVLCAPRRAFAVATALLVIEPVVRVVSYVGGIGDPARIPVYLHTRVDSLLFGAVAALLPVVWPEVHRRVLATIVRLRLAAVALGLLAISAWAAAVCHGAYELPLGWSVDGLCAATILLATEGEGWLRRVLSFRPLVWLGLISFSLYLWQQLFTGPWRGPILGSVALAPVLAILCATVSYSLIELPFLRLKRRFRSPTVPGHRATPSGGVLRPAGDAVAARPGA